MSNNAESLFTSPPFKFIVDGTPVYVHASLVSQHSKPLERMIKGHMVEAQQGFAVLKEVDESTFTRFVQWAYKGYYSAAEHEDRPDDNHEEPTPGGKKRCTKHPVSGSAGVFPQVDEEKTALADIGWSTPSVEWSVSERKNQLKKKGKKYHEGVSIPLMRSTRQDLKEVFIKRKTSTRQNFISTPPPRANKNSNEDYTGVFLSHARLYVFAEQYDIQPLKTLAFEELQLTLASYTLYPERTGDIIALMRYVYANTCEPMAGVKDLRTMLTAYMNLEVDELMKDKAFKDLMIEDGGALLGDFMKVMENRILADD